MVEQNDARLPIVAERLALAVNRSVGLDYAHLGATDIEAQLDLAQELLVEIDKESPDAIIRRLQRELHEAWGNDAVDWNLARAMQIIADIDICRGVLDALKRAFKNEELDGGWRTALTHPLYVSTEARIASLEDELRGLI